MSMEWPPSWPLAASGHYVRFRRATTKSPWDRIGPFFASMRASVGQNMTFVSPGGQTVTAKERLIFGLGTDIRTNDVLLSIELQSTFSVVFVAYEPEFTEVFVTSSDRPDSSLPAPYG